MQYVLRPYQKNASNAAVKAFKEHESNGILVLPTGAGKSLVIADIASKLDKPLLVFCPSLEILQQNYQKICSYGILDVGIYSASAGSKDINRITLATIGSVNNHPEDFSHFDYVMIDECHQVNAQGGMYQRFLTASTSRITIGLTATPYRLHSNMEGSMLKFITRTRPRIFKKVLYHCQISELLERGFLADLKYYDVTKIDMTRLRPNSNGSDFNDQSVIEEFERTGFYDQVSSTIMRLLRPKSGIPRKGILVFTKFVTEAQKIADEIPHSAIVTGETPKKERERILDEFKKGIIKVVANVGVLTTGFDYPELDTIVLARPTKSLSLYYQMCLDMKTEVLTKRGFLTYEEITKDDIVAAYHEGNIVWTQIEEIVHRNVYEGEKFVSFSNNQTAFRVTGEHDLLISSKGAKTYTKEKAIDAINRKGLSRVPVSGIENVEGLPLTDDEIRFIGWSITDGGINKINNALHIVQSTINAKNCNEIEEILQSCGLRYHRNVQKRKDGYADIYHYTISYGNPRSKEERGLSGWNKYSEYINGCKKWNDNFDRMNEHQFDVFVSTLEKADGSHRHALDYTPKTMRICCGISKLYCDSLQSLAVRRGYSAKFSTSITNAGNIMYLLYLKKTSSVTIAGCNDTNGIIQGKSYKRTHMQLEESLHHEEVWCVKDKYGTIVTRYKGKVLIMGNCGRAIRPFEGKDGWIIDMVGNVKRFGKVSDLRLLEYPKKEQWCVFSGYRQLTNVIM